MTIKGGIDVDAIIQRHCVFSPKMVVFWKATDETKPSMIPKAVLSVGVSGDVDYASIHFNIEHLLTHICHIIVRAPRIFFGADSAA
jgi:hypothetical protein